MSYQFYHVETYARSASTKKRPSKSQARKAQEKLVESGAAHADTLKSIKESPRKPDRQKISVGDVIGEALRDEGCTPHIDEPMPPNYLYGNEDAVRNLPVQIELRCNEWTRLGHATVRKDAHVLLAGIASYAREDMEADPKGYQKWKEANITFLKKKFGDQLQAVVEHLDEEHPHIHFYVLPTLGQSPDAKQIHAGFIAAADKAAELAELETDPKKKKACILHKDVGKAYKAAMTLEQDQYFEQVGHSLGMLRVGPKRERLSREAWAQRKDEVALNKKAYERDLRVIAMLRVEANKGRDALRQDIESFGAERATFDLERENLELQKSIFTKLKAKFEVDQVANANRSKALDRTEELALLMKKPKLRELVTFLDTHEEARQIVAAAKELPELYQGVRDLIGVWEGCGIKLVESSYQESASSAFLDSLKTEKTQSTTYQIESGGPR